MLYTPSVLCPGIQRLSIHLSWIIIYLTFFCIFFLFSSPIFFPCVLLLLLHCKFPLVGQIKKTRILYFFLGPDNLHARHNVLKKSGRTFYFMQLLWNLLCNLSHGVAGVNKCPLLIIEQIFHRSKLSWLLSWLNVALSNLARLAIALWSATHSMLVYLIVSEFSKRNSSGSHDDYKIVHV